MSKSVCALVTCLFCLLLQLPSSAWGNVSIRNGNYFASYNDTGFSGGLEPKIERIYNSKSPFRGIFGWAWGCELEVYLTVAADGSLIFYESGGGAEVHFYPPAENAALKQQNINRLIELKIFSTPEEKEAYWKNLHEDIQFRDKEWERAVKNGLVEPRRLPVGTILTSNSFGHMYAVKTRNGYVRYLDSGKKEEYDDSGRLRRVDDTNSNFIAYDYNDKGQMIEFHDNSGRWISLKYNALGLVSGSVDSLERTTEYRYNHLAQLIYSRDIEDNVYEFDYDTRHNLLAIRYSDGTSQDISYYSKAYNENVRRVKDQDGTVTNYAYSRREPNHNKVEITVSDKNNNILRKESYEYFRTVKPNGDEYTRRMIANIDGDITDTEYDDNSSPLKISRNGDVTRFAYDNLGHVISKETQLSKTELEYHQVVNKIIWVRVTNKEDGSVDESRFNYDSKGNLLSATNSENGKVQLSYDSQGRIATMLSANGELAFTYNKNSKPLTITLKGVGEITVIYAANGDIEKVDSSAGRKIALEVTSAFQRLLDILRPAGVSLSF